jgi:hypothetical protein
MDVKQETQIRAPFTKRFKRDTSAPALERTQPRGVFVKIDYKISRWYYGFEAPEKHRFTVTTGGSGGRPAKSVIGRG